MTDEEKKAELARAMAAACFTQMQIAREAQSYVSKVVLKWGDHPAFQDYIASMNLGPWLTEFLKHRALP